MSLNLYLSICLLGVINFVSLKKNLKNLTIFYFYSFFLFYTHLYTNKYL